MKFHQLFLSTIVLGAAVVLATPQDSKAYDTLGFNLVPNESTFRVYNNFLDSAANNNNTPNSQFPGSAGAVMAIWKACVEWGAIAHGNGSGDPTQSELGSGRSNFDPLFNGEATGTGVIGDNIHSALDSSDGGTLAFMQGDSNGWWIRYYENWNWNDGPGSGGYPDLQAVACHEYGHALGLSHSTDSSATMYFSGGSTGARSINSDDVAGIQNIYGGMLQTGTKPTITSVTDLGGKVAITGTNFTTNSNEVWFTRLNPGTTAGGRSGIKVTGVSSTGGGTMIEVNVPASVGPGDLLVKRNSSGQASTSNTFPFDPFSLPPPTAEITSVNPPRVAPLDLSGTPLVTLTGSGFTGSNELVVDDKLVGDPTDVFGGSWTIVSDTQIDFQMPLVNRKDAVVIYLTTPEGTITSSIFIDPPTSPILVTAQTEIIQAGALNFATTAQFGDLVAIKFSGVSGPTVLPGILELEIGNGNLNAIFNVISLSIQSKYWRRKGFGPFTNLPIGVEVFFEGLVFPISTNYGFPWESTNSMSLFITG